MEDRKYSLRNIRQCFPALGGPTLQDWARRGYLSFGRETRGSIEYMVFSWPECVHVGVVFFLSLWGIFRRGTAITLALQGDRPVLLQGFTHAEAIMRIYRRLNFQVAISVAAYPKRREKNDPRTADAAVHYYVAVGPYSEAVFLFESLIGVKAGRGDVRPSAGDGLPSFSFVNVGLLAAHVRRELNVPGHEIE